MMLNEKIDAVESIVKVLGKTSGWRKTTAARFPNDPRNLPASIILDRLAADASGMTDSQWEALKPHFGWSSETWRDALNTTARQVGFHHRGKEFDSFVTLLIHNLSVVSAVAA
jgi:hypothetical protein